MATLIEHFTSHLSDNMISEALNTAILPPNADDSIYACFIPSFNAKADIRDMVDDQRTIVAVTNIGGKMYEMDDYHTTLVYSKTGGKAIYEYVKEIDTMNMAAAISARVTGFTIFGNCVVMLLESHYLQEMFQKCLALGATTDFPDYNPHITIFKLPEDAAEEDKTEILRLLNLEFIDGFLVDYDKVACEPLNPDW